MAGTPVKPGSWGDWATIHSEISDETRRQNGEYTAPGVANADNLNGVECKYARNLSYQLIVCQNSHSLFSGKKCPGHCNDYVADWQHVNALIIGKPRLECVYRKYSGSISYCICCHQKTISCNKCKNYKEPGHAQAPKLESIDKSKAKKKITADEPKSTEDHSSFFKENTFWLSKENKCPFDRTRLQQTQHKIKPTTGKAKNVISCTCTTCKRLFLTESFVRCLQNCGIQVKLSNQVQTDDLFTKHTFYVLDGKKCPFDRTKLIHYTYVINADGITCSISYAVCSVCQKYYISEPYLRALQKRGITVQIKE